MFPARSGITFAATSEQPTCPDKLTLKDTSTGDIIIVQCSLIHGHRQKKHYFSGELPDRDGPVEIFWPKKRSV